MPRRRVANDTAHFRGDSVMVGVGGYHRITIAWRRKHGNPDHDQECRAPYYEIGFPNRHDRTSDLAAGL